MVETPAVLAAVAGIAEEVSKAWQAWAALLGFMAHGGERHGGSSWWSEAKLREHGPVGTRQRSATVALEIELSFRWMRRADAVAELITGDCSGSSKEKRHGLAGEAGAAQEVRRS
ncbi:hypothetical protein M0R45_021615 [Rubus argutus]|uniref:Uncharacterized protein n=1 Tax=Rubus argutus TaxID=59490 RepID=A0AAW1XD67_RUBAR